MSGGNWSINCTDIVALDAWYALAAVNELPIGTVRHTQLLDTAVTLMRAINGDVAVWLGSATSGRALPSRQKFGYVWTTLGSPSMPIFDIPEFDELDRRNMNAASLGIHTSAPRAVENFLDLGHFAFVHTNYLGVEPHTEIKPYRVEISAKGDEVIATKGLAYQPQASIMATSGYEVEYVYRVPHPYCALLYKSNAADPMRQDVIALLVQPRSEEEIVAHLLLSVLDDVSSDSAIRSFQQLIISQDKPLLENQLPRRLPLSSRSVFSIKADATSGTYRRWLSECGVRYGTLPP
jgi:phenylpropionate dioxygenase-like ring-hydroxylating dioxygenase large terminal subunit